MSARRGTSKTGIDLERYFPYRMAVLAEQVSQAVAAVYAVRFHMTRHEWRILAALGAGDEVAATDIGRITTLDKMQVSRAMRALEVRGVVRRALAAGDRRRRIVTLTAAGRALYEEIVPLALARETALLSPLTRDERRQLDVIMGKIGAAATGALDAAA